jgi:PAS domain-containing protein
MGALMRAHDWTVSPLGHPHTWPQSLRTVVSLLLTSKFPMFVAWGPDLGFLYNDGYRPIFGSKHPRALGLPFRDVWSEIWDDIGPLAERALAGEATFSENLHLVMERNGYPEDTWFTFSYSPVRDESGGVGGLFCACTETTGQVLAEEARRKSEEQLRALADNLPYGMVYQIAMKRDGRDRRFTFVSQSSQRLSGVAPEAAMRDPKALYETIPPEHRPALKAAEEASISTLSPMDVEVGFRRADGSLGWCRIISAPRLAGDDLVIWDAFRSISPTAGRPKPPCARARTITATRSSSTRRWHGRRVPTVSWTTCPSAG